MSKTAPKIVKNVMEKKMRNLILLLGIFTLGGCNAIYSETVKKQLADGYKWVQVPCRPANPDLPAITFRGENGEKLVCNVLKKE